jgi:hypothetical protein
MYFDGWHHVHKLSNMMQQDMYHDEIKAWTNLDEVHTNQIKKM